VTKRSTTQQLPRPGSIASSFSCVSWTGSGETCRGAEKAAEDFPPATLVWANAARASRFGSTALGFLKRLLSWIAGSLTGSLKKTISCEKNHQTQACDSKSNSPRGYLLWFGHALKLSM